MDIYLNIIPYLKINDFISLLKVDRANYELRKRVYNSMNIFTIVINNRNDLNIFTSSPLYKYFGNINIKYKSINDELIKILSSIKQIYKLDISECKQITDESFSYLTNIHTLIMKECYNITDKAFSYLSGIHTLDIHGCNQISDKAFSYLSGIHTLDMHFCNQKELGDKAFSYLKGIQVLNGIARRNLIE